MHFGDNLEVMRTLDSGICNLVYIDPPFNTGERQALKSVRTVRDGSASRKGFQGQTYRTSVRSVREYSDAFDDYLEFIEPRLLEARRLLATDGSIFVHLDYREVHYVKVLMDSIFGRESFMNEIIWAYDYGARSKSKWPTKHDNILWYAVDPSRYTFNFEAMERIPYMAPTLVGAEKAARGKTPTDTWWHTIVPTTGSERTGYPTQKPLGILNRIIAVHSNPGDLVMDFFAGSGTTAEAALLAERRALLIDDNPEAMEVIARRLSQWSPDFKGWQPPRA